ncbi:MAG: hypothetical protein RLZZ142_1435 [Verrucomicrobiota bacterium]
MGDGVRGEGGLVASDAVDSEPEGGAGVGEGVEEGFELGGGLDGVLVGVELGGEIDGEEFELVLGKEGGEFACISGVSAHSGEAELFDEGDEFGGRSLGPWVHGEERVGGGGP